MLGPLIPNVNPQALIQVATALLTSWPDLQPPFSLYQSPGTHANTGNHIVAVDAGGACVGLKAANRIARGTAHECTVSELAVRLQLPMPPRQKLMQPIPNLPNISGVDFIA